MTLFVCLIIPGECKVRNLIFPPFSLLIHTHQDLHIQITVVPSSSVLEETKYLFECCDCQTQKGFISLSWNCLQRILLKILPANKSLSFEGKVDIWKSQKDLTYKEPSQTNKVTQRGPKQSLPPSPVDLNLRSLPETAVTRTRHTEAGIFAIYTIGYFFLC